MREERREFLVFLVLEGEGWREGWGVWREWRVREEFFWRKGIEGGREL